MAKKSKTAVRKPGVPTARDVAAKKGNGVEALGMPMQPPYMAPMNDQTLHPGQTRTFPLSGYDPDGGTVSFVKVSGPDFCAVTNNPGQVVCTPDWEDLFAFLLTVKAVDDEGESSSPRSCIISVTNHPPCISTLYGKTAHPGTPLTVNIQATDPDYDPITYSLSSGPAGAAIDENTGVFTWTPGWTQLGGHTVTVRASDPGNAFDEKSFQVNVTNQAPSLPPITDKVVKVGFTLTFSVYAYDTDNDTLSFEWVRRPCNAVDPPISTGPNSCLVSITPNASHIGTHIATIKAKDPGNASAERSFLVTVNP